MDDSSTSSKPPCHREDAVQVVQILRAAGHVAYFAGGCVRDLLLGLEPKDYDVATDAPPQKVRSLFRSTQAVGQAFGVILVRLGRSVVEVATFRSDGAYVDGRRPSEVRFTTAQEDAKRRDFTINGLFLDPIEHRVLDYVGGEADLHAKVLRAIGEPEARFAEDHLRLMRAVRFAARFNFTIEPRTAAAIRHHAPQLARISPERIGEEARLMLTPPTRPIAWEMLRSLGLSAVLYRFLPEAAAAGPVGGHSLLASLAWPGQVPFGLALAATTLDVIGWIARGGDAERRDAFNRAAVHHFVRALRQSLRISNEDADQLTGSLEGLAPLLADAPPSVATMKRSLARPTAALSRSLLDAFAAAGLWTQRIADLRAELFELEQGEFAPVALVTGDDLTAAGLSPGPLFKKVLDQVYDAQLENRVSTKDEALELALRLAGEKPPS
jgi:poly(A) polymerase